VLTAIIIYMNPRTLEILQAVIREFIDSGEPVSSRKLCRKCDFGVKDATIRNELNRLTEEEYLGQPHTSSGRVPTDKGYRFLVEQVMADLIGGLEFETEKSLSFLKEEFARQEFDEFVGDFAEELELLGVGYAPESREVYKSGLDELFSYFVSDYEISEPRELFQIVKDFEMLDERMSNLMNFISQNSSPRVFIGKSPITRSPELSVIADRFEMNGEPFVLAAIGPKRMDYEKNLRFFKQLREIINR